MSRRTALARCARTRLIPAGASVAIVLSGLASLSSPAPAQTPAPSAQIAAAVLPLPVALRAAAGVVRLDQQGRPHELRPSANGMVCLADTPGDSVFDVRCYQRSFVPFVYRGRQLAASGVPDSMIDRRIDAEVRSGKLKLPTGATAGYRMLGPIVGYDSSANTVSDTIDAWQSIHLPYRTAAAIGLPTREDGTHPYVMASGTYWSHVMILERPSRY
jgi:hypothetical protein